VTLADTVFSVAVTVVLVVGLELGADGILLGVYAAGAPFTLWLAVDQRRRLALWPDVPLLRRMLRFGLPTMPAELSLYALNVIDRIALARLAGLAEAGLYAIAFKFSQAIQVLIRGFQLAWPPLAYSIVDDDEARRAYAVIVTWFAVAVSFAVAGLWLEARWIVRLLAAPEYFASYEALGLLSLGSALYGFYLVLLVVLGRTGRTEFNLPATAAAAAVNIVLNIILIPPLGIVGSALALVASYIVVLVLMFGITQRLFFVPYEWGRLAAAVAVAAALTAGGELLLPTEGAVGLISRAGVWFAYPVLLWAGGFATHAERARAAELARQARERAWASPSL
jgi:O-antigen/teichoic acid export membrane protein